MKVPPNFGKATILSLGFMLLFTAFNTCQNFASKILDDDGFGNLGFINLACIYLAFAICSFFSAAIVNKINKLSVSLSLGAFCYTFWIVCFLLPCFYHKKMEDHVKEEDLPWILKPNLIKAMLIVTSILVGLGAGILWVSQGNYLSECATDEKKGFFNGYFWAFFMSAMIIGNLIGAFLLAST
jgi:MFS family permease